MALLHNNLRSTHRPGCDEALSKLGICGPSESGRPCGDRVAMSAILGGVWTRFTSLGRREVMWRFDLARRGGQDAFHDCLQRCKKRASILMRSTHDVTVQTTNREPSDPQSCTNLQRQPRGKLAEKALTEAGGDVKHEPARLGARSLDLTAWQCSILDQLAANMSTPDILATATHRHIASTYVLNLSVCGVRCCITPVDCSVRPNADLAVSKT